MKILTDKIKGFAEMGSADKVAALLSLDLPDPIDMSPVCGKKFSTQKATEHRTYQTAEIQNERRGSEAAKEAEERAEMERTGLSQERKSHRNLESRLSGIGATTRKQQRKTKLCTPEILRKYFPIRRNLLKRRKKAAAK